MVAECALVDEGPVDDDHLAAVGAEERGMVDERHRRDDEGHEPEGRHRGRRRQPADEAEGEQREVVGDLVLGQLVRAEPDDREHAEETQTDPRAHGGAREERRHREHPDVDSEEGDDEVATSVPGPVDAEGQQCRGGQVGGVEGEGGHVADSLRSV